MPPSVFNALDRYERAFIIGAIEYKVEQDKKREKALNAKQQRGRKS